MIKKKILNLLCKIGIHLKNKPIGETKTYYSRCKLSSCKIENCEHGKWIGDTTKVKCLNCDKEYYSTVYPCP